MTILFTNDDGYKATGINALIEVFEERGHECWVMAPSGNRSAQSHAMNLTIDIHITPYKENKFHCSGTPTDCILYGMKSNVFPRKPDLVISGINHGYNCSSDILYSGTCGAASEAVMQGIPAIAISQDCDEERKYKKENLIEFANFLADNLDKFVSLTNLDSFVNINSPSKVSKKAYSANVGFINYGDQAEHKGNNGEGGSIYKLCDSSPFTQRCDTENTDYTITRGGDISVSVIKVLPEVDKTAHERIEELFK